MKRSGKVWKYGTAVFVVLMVGVLLSEVSAQGSSKVAEVLLSILGNTEVIKAEILSDMTVFIVTPSVLGVGKDRLHCAPDQDVLLHVAMAPFSPSSDGSVEIAHSVPNLGVSYTANVSGPAGLTYGVPAGKSFQLEVTGVVATVSIQSPEGTDLGCILDVAP